MNILILEDNDLQRETLSSIINKTYFDIRVYDTDTIATALDISKNKSIDLFFVDINLPDGSGIDFGKEIRTYEMYTLTPIVFITTEIIHMIDAFKTIHCYDFLIKPYNIENVKKTIDIFNNNLFTERPSESKYSIFNIDSDVSLKIYHHEIIFVEYSLRTCTIHTTKGKFTKCITLSKLLDNLSDECIIQSHKAYLVNTKHIERIEKIYNKLWNIKFTNYKDDAQLSYKFKGEVFEKWI